MILSIKSIEHLKWFEEAYPDLYEVITLIVKAHVEEELAKAGIPNSEPLLTKIYDK